MIKKFLILFLISFTSLFSQKLKFDVMTEYSIFEGKSFYDKSAYMISNNDNYIMQILNQYDGQQLAEVYDLKSLQEHQFKIKQSKSNSGLITYSFVYIKTRTFERPHVKKKYFDFRIISYQDNIETVKMIVYKNKSKSKIESAIDLQILKSEVNFFPLFRFACLHGLEFFTELNYLNGGLVTSCISQKGSKIATLKAFLEVNLELTIPD